MLEASPLPFPPLDADEPKAWPALLVVMVPGIGGAGAGAHGGGGGGSVGMSDPTQFMTSIPYAPPVIEAIQQRPEEDQFAKLMQQANMFNRKDYDAQLDGVIARGMFEGMA